MLVWQRQITLHNFVLDRIDGVKHQQCTTRSEDPSERDAGGSGLVT